MSFPAFESINPVVSINPVESMKVIKEVERECGGLVMLNLAISLLLATGTENFTDEDVANLLSQINDRHARYEKNKLPPIDRSVEECLVRSAQKLATVPLFDLLLYIQRGGMQIHDPDKAAADEIPYRENEEETPNGPHCTVCFNDYFFAYQKRHQSVVITGQGYWERDLPENESGAFYGPFNCTKCGMEYDDLDDLGKGGTTNE